MAERTRPLPYRPNTLLHPVTPEQVQGTNDTFNNIYDELRYLRQQLALLIADGGGGGGTTTPHHILSTTHDDSQVASAVDGDLLYRDGGVWKRLPIGSAGEALQVVTGAPVWDAIPPSPTTPHDILSVTHPDTDPAVIVTGDLLRGSAGALLERLPIGADGQILVAASGLPEWTGSAPSSLNHDLLSTTHPDTEPDAPQSGDIIVGRGDGISAGLGATFLDGEQFGFVPTADAATFLDGEMFAAALGTVVPLWERKGIGSLGQVLTVVNISEVDWQTPVAASAVVASVYKTGSNQVMTESANTIITFQTVDIDDAAFYAAATPNRLTIPANYGGTYLARGQVTFYGGYFGLIYLMLYVNGVKVTQVLTTAGGNISLGYLDGPSEINSKPLRLNAGDYVQLLSFVVKFSGGDAIALAGANSLTQLSLVKV